MTKFLITQILLSCRLSTGVLKHSIYGRSFIAWRITTYLWRYVRVLRIVRGASSLGIDDNIIYGFDLHLLRRLTISNYDM
jgi:hypothetical protein